MVLSYRLPCDFVKLKTLAAAARSFHSPALHRGEPHGRLRGSRERPRQPDPGHAGV